MSNVYVAISMTNGMVYHMTILGEGRFPSQPRDGFWQPDLDGEVNPTGLWRREVNDTVISFEVNKASYVWAKATPDRPAALPTGWRVLSDDEHQQFETDRVYRNALIVDEKGVLKHDIVRARDCHRGYVRKQRATAMVELDAKWMKFKGQGKDSDAAAVETQRQGWRDAPADQRIEAAQSVDDLKKLL